MMPIQDRVDAALGAFSPIELRDLAAEAGAPERLSRGGLLRWALADPQPRLAALRQAAIRTKQTGYVQEYLTPPDRVVEVVSGALIRDGRVWLAQRHPSAVAEWSEAWCLPGGKVEAGETPQEALRREWREEASVNVAVGALLSARTHETPGYPHPYRVRTYLVGCGSEPRLTHAGGQRAAWWPVGELPQPRLPSTDHAFEDAPPVVVVGEMNPYGGDPRYALYDEPVGSAGGRLRRLVFGLRSDTYHRRTRRFNLCTGVWSTAKARASASRILGLCGQDDTVVLLGRKVAAAFGLDHLAPFTSKAIVHEDRKLALRYVLLPHPSGRCRGWNEPGAYELAREMLSAVRPDVPWGESDGPPPAKVRRCGNCGAAVPEGDCPECGPGGHYNLVAGG